MRTVVVTGPAGAGSTSVARALAQQLQTDGRRTVLLRQIHPGDPAPEAPSASAPATVVVDPLQWGTQMWDALGPVRRFLGEPWADLGGFNVLPLPPLPELAWWGALRNAWQEPWDAVVVDAGPLESALRWLTMPDLTVGLLRRTWPLADRSGEAADRLLDGSWHLRAMARLDSEAAELADRLRSSATAVHLVTPPRPHELGRALHALTPLALFEVPVTDLVVNRVQTRRSYDRALMDRLPARVPGLVMRTAAEHRHAPAATDLGGELYPDVRPAPRPPRPRVGRTGERLVWSWPMPFAEPEDVSAIAAGEDLILTVGDFRRVVALPSVLRRCVLQGADFVGNVLQLSFTPNPDVWPVTQEVS